MRITSAFTKWAGVAMLALSTIGLGSARAIASPPATPSAPQNPKYESWLNNQVRHELVMLPWYGVFDNLVYSVNGTEVTLTGQVVNPVTKSDAASVVKHIEGVTKVTDNITVLPPSPMDFQIRHAEYRAIFSYSDLYRYGMGVNPSIHIIVDNGHVTLVGYVDNQTDAHLAYMRANSVPGVFSVTNDLQVSGTKAS